MSNPPLISVVDDDESVRESLSGLIRSVGFGVTVFASAEEFLNSNHLSDTNCLILDVRMPGMNGLELQRRLAASHRSIPVIFITAHGDPATRAKIERVLPGTPVLAKPITAERLKEAIASVMKG